jgi:ferredoxin
MCCIRLKSYKICIDREQCIGDGLCVNEAPETFELDDDQKAVVVDGPGNDLEYILAAAKSCPLDIITVVDNATAKKLYP